MLKPVFKRNSNRPHEMVDDGTPEPHDPARSEEDPPVLAKEIDVLADDGAPPQSDAPPVESQDDSPPPPSRRKRKSVE